MTTKKTEKPLKTVKTEKPVKVKKPTKTLTQENLILLGAEQLAELLLEISKGNAVSQRILRTALAGAVGVGEAAKEIRKRINMIARAKTYIDSVQKKSVLKDLAGLKNQILKQVLPNNPADATDLMWSLMRLSNGIMYRSTDDSGTLHDFFSSVILELSHCVIQAQEKPYILAERIFNDIFDNDYGQYATLIPNMAQALGTEGLETLKTKLQLENTDKNKAYDTNIALQDIAEALGDIDAYIALKSEYEIKIPRVAAKIALKLLNLGRADDAWKMIENADCKRYQYECGEWAEAKLILLEAMGKPDEAQAFRYFFFQETLSVAMLKAYLKQLPEFTDFQHEQKALEFVTHHEDIHHAMYFMTLWHAPKHLNDMVLKRYDEVDGNIYEVLPMVAKTLASDYPLSATLILRKLIDDSLDNAKSSRYKHTAKHLAECNILSQYIQDYKEYDSHNDYVKNLKNTHGKKYSFWGLV